MSNAYLLAKTAHLVFVIAWMAAIFYLPRILVNLREAGDVPAVRERLLLMGRRLYRFGHVMFGLAVLLGLVLWLVYFIFSGRMLKGVASGRALPPATALRWFNETPVLLLAVIVWLVLAKPF